VLDGMSVVYLVVNTTGWLQ